MRKLTISIDFDNTITIGSRNFPECGRLRRECVRVINMWHEMGHYIIINTCRNPENEQKAILFLVANGIHFDKINENNPYVISFWGGDTRKISADLYFDDRSGVVNWKSFEAIANRFSKPTVICIVGESGSGKSLVADLIQEHYSIPMIESRTTRAPRTEGETGHTFVTEAEFDAYQKEDMIAFTKFGDARYCCLKRDVKIRNTYVIDETGLKYLEKNFSSEFNIFSIRIIRDEDLRVKTCGEERVSRDKGKFTMFIYDYNAIIRNDGSVEGLLWKIDRIMEAYMLYI